MTAMPVWFAPALAVSGILSVLGLLKQAKDKHYIEGEYIGEDISEGFRLASGDRLLRGSCLTNGNARLCVQPDGNLVITFYGKAVWSTGTRGADKLQMNTDGNLVLYSGGKALWNTSTHGHPKSRLALGPDGNLVVYDAASHPLWSSFRRKGSEGLIGSGIGVLSFAGRQFDHVTKAVTRTAKKVPGLGSAVKAGESALHGAVAQKLTGWMRNPYVSTAFGPIMIPANIAIGATSGGIKGATVAAKAELRNPIRRAAVKAVAVVFPPAAPGAVALEAANKLIDAADHGDAVEAAKAAAQIASIIALSEDGDPTAKNTLAMLKKASIGRKAGAMTTAIFSLPKGASKAAITKAATGVLALAAKGNPKALALVKNTATQAKKGNRKAIEGAKVLASVGRSAGHVADRPALRAKGRGLHGSYKKAKRASKGKSFSSSYLVDSKGNVFKGTFAAK